MCTPMKFVIAKIYPKDELILKKSNSQQNAVIAQM